MQETLSKLKDRASRVRRQALEMIVSAGRGHIGGTLSCVDLLVALYYSGIFHLHPDEEERKRDRFILSKGHACAALYAILADLGYFSPAELRRFNGKGGLLAGHPDRRIAGIEADTGSLGHGLGIGIGLALSAKIDKKEFRTVVLLGDGECAEGSVWEAALFAAQHQLGNLTGIIDHNGLCATGSLRDCLSMEPLEGKWRAFGWDTATIDGHSFEAMLATFGAHRPRNTGRPLMVIARTVKGKGVSFMEGEALWHHRVPAGDELARAREELSLLAEEAAKQ